MAEEQKVTFSSVTKDQSISWFRKAELYSKAASAILKQFRIFESTNLNVESLLEQECERLERDEVLLDSSHIVTALLEREERSGVGIPGTSLALFHTRAVGVINPVFTIVRLMKPINRKAMDGSSIEMDTILLQLAAEESSSEAIEIMSFISTLIIESEQTIALFSESDQETIELYLANKIKNHVEKQLEIKGDDYNG
nr:PTS sugar transporter subunit IIA [Bacillus sp. NTK071]